MIAKPSTQALVLLAIGVGEPSETVQLGVACVAAALEKAFGPHMDLVCLEGSLTESAKSIAERVLSKAPAFVGLSLYTWNRAKMGAVVESLERGGYRGLLFAGGPEASADPFGLAAELALDFVVVGEGEETSVEAFRRLLKIGGGERDGARGRAAKSLDRTAKSLDRAAKSLDRAADSPSRPGGLGLEDIAGVALPGKASEFRRRPPPAAAGLPSPWLGGQASPKDRDEVVWELSRGCAFHCTYCYEGRGVGGVRAFAPDRVEAELGLLVREGARRIFVLDPTFNWKRERALGLLALFAAKGASITWKFEARAELIDRSLAKAFARLDASIQIGLQSADPEVLARVGRPGFDADRFAAKVGLLDAEGVTWGLDLIFGLPGDSLSGFRKSLDYALGLAPNHLDVFPLSVLPGTELAEDAAAFGLRAEASAPHRLLESPSFPAVDLAKAAALARACDLFYTRGRAVSWFLRALAPLKTRPSTFLGRFADWLEAGGGKGEAGRAGPTEGIGQAAIEDLQLDFLESEYRDRGQERLLPLLRDLVRFEGAWGRAVGEGETTQLELSHEARFIVEPPTPDIRELARMAKPRPTRIRVAPGRGGPEIRPVGKRP
ncbi:MAG TPA: radical SAM protein [Rectinemataceae bacterium]|nr:radical SAM protein [Rectinemataceae bacterium]